MWVRTLALTLSSFTILATSFCTHKNDGHRNVSSSLHSHDVESAEPIVLSTPQGHRLFVTEHYHNERDALIEVQYACEKDADLHLWEKFRVDRFGGVSDLIKGSIFQIKFQPLGYLDLSNESKKQTEKEKKMSSEKAKVYDLKVVCPF